MTSAHAADPTADATVGPVARATWPDDQAPSPAREAAVTSLGLVVLGLFGYGVSLGIHLGNLHNGVFGLTSAAVGLYVLRMRPRHPVGRLFVAVGLVSAVMFFGRQYALHEPRLPGADWFAWVSIWAVPIAMMLTGWAMLVFPTGRTLSARWRRTAVAVSGIAVVLAVASSLWPIEDDWRSETLRFPFDLGGAAVVEEVAAVALPICYQGFLLFWAASVVMRIRRAVGDETRQLRWFVYAVGVVLVVTVGGTTLAGTPVPGLLLTPLIPVAAGIAILKYRLYDIDQIIDRTVVVAALAALITVGYVAVVVGVGILLPASHTLLSLLATAAVAVLFEPVRRRAQRLANRLVHGPRATPYEALARLSAQIDAPPDDVLAGLCATVAHAVGATTVMLWVGDEEELRLAAAYPAGAAAGVDTLEDLLEREARSTIHPIRHRGVTLGVLTVRCSPGVRLGPAEEPLLGDLVAQAGLVIDHQARLREVAEQADELRAAARRVVTAQDDARRRLERDLHDGAQHRLVTLALELGEMAGRAAGNGDGVLAARAEAARAQLLEATAELREMARGLHPAVLTHDGLAPAVANLADRAAIPVDLTVSVDRRLPPEIEATAYFIVAESLTNAARYSGAEEVRVVLAHRDGELTVEVVDDGVGGAAPAAGSGLQGLADRLAALGARLTVQSPSGGGTTVRTSIRCGVTR